MASDARRFAYDSPTIVYGPGAVEELQRELGELEATRALIVTGRTVGEQTAVMEPVREGLGQTRVGTFAEVTSAKTLGTAAAGAAEAIDREADMLIGVGGGATLDTTKLVSVLSTFPDPHRAAERMIDRDRIRIHEGRDPLDIVGIPTTLPGADLSFGAGAGMSMRRDVDTKAAVPGGGVSDPRLMPAAVYYDASLVATTPPSILRRSAMNGYDKGIEMLYARAHTPVTDATAMRGLSLLQRHLPALDTETCTPERLNPILEGISLVQYGLSSPGAYRASVIHAAGHALTDAYPIQQGVAHAIAAPAVLRYLFEETSARVDVLAEALDVTDASNQPDAIVAAVEDTRDALGLPDSLTSVPEASPADVPQLARAMHADSFMAGAPSEFEPTPHDLEAVFAAMFDGTEAGEGRRDQ